MHLIKIENEKDGFSIGDIKNDDFLIFNNINELESKFKIQYKAKVFKSSKIEIHENESCGKLITICRLNKKNNSDIYEFDVPEIKETSNICFLFKWGKWGASAIGCFRI